MGKASRRQRGVTSARPAPVPFVPRPFEGLPGETGWVAVREILPAATARVRVRAAYADGAGPLDVTVATVLPLAWPGLHRADGTRFVGTQGGGASGDASRDLAAAVLAVVAAEAGTPVASLPSPTADTPRLQDILDPGVPFEVTVHDGFEFWVGETELDEDATASLERANASVVPTTAMSALPSAYFVRIGERAHIRLVLPDDEDPATDALSRLHAAGADGVGGDSRLLGAFRAGGLLVPVWDLDPDLDAADHEEGLAAFGARYADALADTSPLGADERRARAGLLSRQVTLR